MKRHTGSTAVGSGDSSEDGQLLILAIENRHRETHAEIRVLPGFNNHCQRFNIPILPTGAAHPGLFEVPALRL